MPRLQLRSASAGVHTLKSPIVPTPRATGGSLPRSALRPTKLVFPCGDFMRSVDIHDAIFKLTGTLGSFCAHHVCIEPAGISDALSPRMNLWADVGVGPISHPAFTTWCEVSARTDDAVSIGFRSAIIELLQNAAPRGAEIEADREWRHAFRCPPSRAWFKPSASDV